MGTCATELKHRVASGWSSAPLFPTQGAEGIDILGQNIKATGDTLLDHGRGDLNIGGYENSTVVENNSHVETISTEVGVRNAYVDAALAVQAVAKAGEAVKQAKDQYSQAEKDYQSGKITKQALEDSKANVVMATANLANAQIAVGAAAAAATSYGTGFTIGANGERVETDSTTTRSTGQWQGSNLELNNLTLKSEGQDVNIQGSRLSATDTTYFDGTKDLNVTAGTEHGSERSDSKTNSQSVSYTYGGGASASLGKQSSTAQSDSLSHVNSQVELNRTEGSIDSLNIQGGNVSIADRGNLQVNNIHVESLQDTASSSNSSKGGSIGGGTSGNVSASYNQSKGSSESAWVNTTSTLLIGDANNGADLDAMGVKSVTNIGGIIANATRNEDGTLTDHQNLNYTGNLELKDIADHNYSSGSGFNVSTSIGIPQGGTKAASTAPQGSTTIGLNSSGQETEQLTKATMGQGTIAQATDSTNRDINTTQEITRDQTTGMLDGSITVDHRLLSESGRAEIVQEQKDIPQNAEVIGKMTAAGGMSLGVAAAGLASGDQTLAQAYQTLMNPANTFDFVQKNPEAATVIEQFKQGEYDGILASKESLQLLAGALGQDVNLLTTSLTNLVQGAYDKIDQTITLDVTDASRKDLVNTLGHEVAHGQGISSETRSDIVGTATNLGFESGIIQARDQIDSFKTELGDGKDLITQVQNQQILEQDNQQLLEAMIDHGDEIDEKTSYKQDLKNTFLCWNAACQAKYNEVNNQQQAAYMKGQQQAVKAFIDDVKNLPNVPQELYQALKNNPAGTAKAILSALAAIPGEVWDTGETLTVVNLVGDTPAEFEKLGKADMSVALAALTAGSVKVVTKGGQVGFEAVKDVKRILQNDPAKLPTVTMSSSGNISASQISTNGKIIDPPKEVLNKQKELLNNTNNTQTGVLREQIADSYFTTSGYTKLESKCGSNCFDGVYMKNGELYIVEVKPLKERGSVKLNSANQSTGLDVQMTDGWVISRANALRGTGNPDAIKTANLIDKAVDSKKPINKIVVGVNENRTVTLNLGNKVTR